MNELIQLEMTLEEARETDRLIKRHINTTRYLLLDMRDRKGWKALGYESFVEYGEKELNFGSAYLYRLADSAEISLQLGFSPIGENQPKESQLRPLAQVPDSERKAIWEEATRKAEEEGAKLTAKRVEEAVAEWKQRNEEWKAQWKGERDRAGQLQAELEIAKAILDQKSEPVIIERKVIPDDYEQLKKTERDLRGNLAELKQQQRELVQQQVVAKLKEREAELTEIDRKVQRAETQLAGLQTQIDRYSMQQRELKVHLDTIEAARVAMAMLAANLEGFDVVIDRDHELRQWHALVDMLRQGAAAIEHFIGDAKPALTVIQGSA